MMYSVVYMMYSVVYMAAAAQTLHHALDLGPVMGHTPATTSWM